MPKFRVQYANIVLMEQVVEATSEDLALDKVLTGIPAGVDPRLREHCEALEHVTSVEDYEHIWEAEEE